MEGKGTWRLELGNAVAEFEKEELELLFGEVAGSSECFKVCVGIGLDGGLD